MIKHISSLIALCLMALSVMGQTQLKLTTTQGVTHTYTVEETGGVYFNDSTLLIRENLNEGANDYYRYADIRKITLEAMAGISAVPTQQVSLYPNPSQDYLAVKGIQGHCHLQLFDAMGRKVLDQQVTDAEMVDIRKFAPGVYVARLDEMCIKFVKQ